MSVENDGEFVSRTKKKQEVEELQKIGAALVDLPPAQLDDLSLPGELLDAVREAQRIRSHGARRRQLQYIGKIMRGVDPAPVLAALAAVAGRSKAAKLQQTQLENWRSRLIGDDDALTAFASDHPGVNLQTLRTLIRNSRKELDEGKPPRAQRELFRVIREALE